MSGMTCDVNGCKWNDGNGNCECEGIYISDCETGEPMCMSAEFEDESEIQRRCGMEKMLFTNNSRKMLGIPLRRKKDKRRRVYTRNRAEEDLEALLNYWDGKWDDIGSKTAAGSPTK